MNTSLKTTAAQPWTRRVGTVALACSALWLAACGSNVKLDDNKTTPAPITDSSASNSTTPSSTVAPVVAAQDNAGALDASLPRQIYFDYDSFVVKEEYRPAIEGYAKALNAAKSRKLTVEGHTDNRGGSEYNLALGQKRAEATVKSLTLLGVTTDQLEAVSFGKERPAVEGSTEDAFAKNRRAEFKSR